MENDREKKLQEEIIENIKDVDNTGQLSNNKDASAYRLLFNVLATKDDDIQIPDDFAEVVTKKAIQKKQISLGINTILLYALPIILLISLSIVSLFFISKEVFTDLISFVIVYHKSIIFAVVIITLVQLADRWLLPRSSGFSTN